MLAVLEALAAFGPKSIEACTPEEARLQPSLADAGARVLKEGGGEAHQSVAASDVEFRDLTIALPTSVLRTRVFSPVMRHSSPLPIVVYFHGGLWVAGDLDAYDATARALSAACHSVVLSVEYRRSPEARFPMAWDDCLEAYHWAVLHFEMLGGDGERFALAGEGAGGTLALATAVAARDTRLQAPRHVLALYPLCQTGNLATASYLENAVGQPLNRAMVPWSLAHLLNSGDELDDTRLDLVHADLSRLPPITIINAELDPLRTDGELLAVALKGAGVECSQITMPGVTHDFFGMSAVLSKARDAQAFAANRLRVSFNWDLH